MLHAKPGQSFQASQLESLHILRVSVGYPSHPEHISWCEFPIREVARVSFDEDAGLVRERCPYGVVVRKYGYSPQFFQGILRFHTDRGVEMPVTFGDPPVNVGAAVQRASEIAAGVALPAGVLSRQTLEKVGATHVDLTLRGQDGELKTTRSIEVSKVSEALPGEYGYVVLRDSTAQLHGDVRVKVPSLATRDIESVPGGFAAQVMQTVRNRGSDYGHPSMNHQLTADMWNAYLSRRLGKEVRMSAEDVCMLNVLQKASRLANGTKDDSWLDIAGYTENVGMLRRDQRNVRTPKG